MTVLRYIVNMVLFFLSAFTVWARPSTNELCRHYDRWIAQGVPPEPLQQLLVFYRDRYKDFQNTRYLSLADYSINSKTERFFLLDTKSGTVVKEHVSHGSGHQKVDPKCRGKKCEKKKYGDLDHPDGMLDACQRKGRRTNMTRVGFFKTKGLYFSPKHDRKKKKRKGWPDLKLKKTKTRYNGLRLDGLSITNGESLSQGVVMHEAYYNEGETMGRSYGCPAFRPGKGSPIFEKIQTGSLFYGYAPQCGELMKGVMEDVVGWDEICGKNSKRDTQ